MSRAFYFYLDMMRMNRNIPFKSSMRCLIVGRHWTLKKFRFLNEWTCSVKCAMDKIETARFTQDDLQEVVLGLIFSIWTVKI